jgi:hypothetical protein
MTLTACWQPTKTVQTSCQMLIVCCRLAMTWDLSTGLFPVQATGHWQLRATEAILPGGACSRAGCPAHAPGDDLPARCARPRLEQL